ncbi:MAG TPA: dienelactone hydrolase family protein [Pyrinomonadaceae bacterium]|nr:dienelactone hydrolase family protein [Pyrinomonadaceae bacterium]
MVALRPIVSHSTAGQQSTVGSVDQPKATIVEKVICADDATQSYALYLPAKYSNDHSWPVLFAFDPMARGKVPVEHYKDAAEKFGWIVIGSNNSRNGSMQQSINAWNAMVKDAQQRFRLDENRVYVTGFSGGARVAIFLAAQCQGCIAGVVAAGAGFPIGLDATRRSPLPIFVTVGVDDFNFAELSELDQTLNKAGTNHLVEEFAGRHDWPPADVAADALEWMELQAMKSGTRLSDQQFIQSAWQSKWTRAHSFIDAKKYYEAFQAYSAIIQTFNTLHDVTEARNEFAKLQNHPEVKTAIRDEQRQIARQREIEARVRRLIATSQRVSLRDDADNSGDNSRRAENVSEEAAPELQLKTLFADLRKQAAKSEDNGDRRVARRVVDGAFINFYEQGRGELEEKHFDAAVRWFILASETNPDRFGVFIYLASAYAGKGDKKKSLRALKTAVDHGFSDVAAIANNPLFDSIRGDTEFQEIIKAIQSKKAS